MSVCGRISGYAASNLHISCDIVRGKTLLMNYKMYIGNRWVDASDGGRDEVINPFTGKSLSTIPVATQDDVKAAVGAAVEAGPAMAKMPAYKRAEVLRRTSDLLKTAEHDIAKTIAAEAGKAYKFALGEVRRAQETFGFAA